MCTISIIIPIYGVESYLDNCLESIRNQTYSDFEVIMVDDGSPDGSAEICRRYVELDSRFSLIQQVNSGVTAARRAGVSVSSGEYIVFVDGDDSLPLDSLEMLISYACDDYDIIVGQPDCTPLVNKEMVVAINEYREKLIFGKLYLAMWARLYRRTLFDSFCFDMPREITAGEDWITNLRLALNTEKKVLLLPNVVYKYDMRPAGVSSTIKRTVEHAKMVYDALIKSVTQYNASMYLHMISNAFVPIWIKRTKRMCKLSETALSFRENILKNLGENPQMSMKEKLFFFSTNSICRFVLICLSCVVAITYSMLQHVKIAGHRIS